LKMDANRAVAWGDLAETYAKANNQNAAVYCLLKGYEVSRGDTLGFIKSLAQDKSPQIVDAGRAALARIMPNAVDEYDATKLLVNDENAITAIKEWQKHRTSKPFELKETEPHKFLGQVCVWNPATSSQDGYQSFDIDTQAKTVSSICAQ
jgi:hypothetical protein